MIPYLGAISRPNALNLADLKIGELASNLSRLMHSLNQPPKQPSFYCGVSYPLSRPKMQIDGVGHPEDFWRAVIDKETAMETAVVMKPPDIVIEFRLC